MSYFKNRIKAFGFAFSGLLQSFRQETHLKLHLVIAACVFFAGFYLQVSKADWIILSLAVTLVISLEMFNSALEKLCDLVMPQPDPRIKYIKDVAAGAVLIACIFAVVAGILVFLPYLKSN